MNIHYRLLLVASICAFGLKTNAQMNPKFKFEEALKLIQENYVDPVNDEHLVDEAVKAMIGSLDPHSSYTSREQSEAMKSRMSGSFAGIGISFAMMNDSTFVTDITLDGPAMKTGLQTGDQIVTVDGKSLMGIHLQNPDVMKLLRGEVGTKVTLGIKRKGIEKLLEYTITRARILDKSVKSAYMIDKEIGYISLSIFSESTRREMDTALKTLTEQGMKKLILDLQSNGGGYVEQAIGVVDEFLPKQKMIFYSVPNIGGKDYYYTGGFGRFYEGEMVVLIDESTASSAEITSGALQDWDRAVLVGRRTFGKGIMQKQLPLSDGSVLHLTAARYYTPSGRSIQRSYQKGKADYFEDFNRRMASHDLTEEGHFKYADSLKVLTLGTKRVVYGGGGIMPDKFIPIDTNIYSNWMASLMNSGIVNKVSFDYVQAKREELLNSYPVFGQYLTGFVIPASVNEEVAKLADKYKIGLPALTDKVAFDAIDVELRAQIASMIYVGTDCFSPIRNQVNKSYLAAIEILKNQKEYNHLLSIKGSKGKSKKIK